MIILDIMRLRIICGCYGLFIAITSFSLATKTEEDFDINAWYSSNPSQNCIDLCSSMSLFCDAGQTMQLNTYERMQEVVSHFGSYCAKWEGFWASSPTYEYYGGMGCWYFGDPDFTYDDAVLGCSVAAEGWNKRACACSAAADKPSSQPTSQVIRRFKDLSLSLSLPHFLFCTILIPNFRELEMMEF